MSDTPANVILGWLPKIDETVWATIPNRNGTPVPFRAVVREINAFATGGPTCLVEVFSELNLPLALERQVPLRDIKPASA